MKVIYQSKDYSLDKVRRRYVKAAPFADQGYYFCEVGDDARFDIRQGYVDASDIPADIREAADARVNEVFGAVEWPLHKRA